MKSKLYLFLLASTALLASCEKWIPDTNYVVGSWQLQYAERVRSYGNEQIYTGYENGSFYLRNNGSAEYSDHLGRMTGTWRMVQHNDGYYDEYGNWQSGPRNSLELRLYDNYRRDVIEWEFYAIEFSGNRMVGHMNRYGNEYIYVFRRY